jgi:hypothetical protein
MPTPLDYQRVYYSLSEKYSAKDNSIETIVADIREIASANGTDLNSILDKVVSTEYAAEAYEGVSVKNILIFVWRAAIDEIDHEGKKTDDLDVIASKKGSVIYALARCQNTYGLNIHSSPAGIAKYLLSALALMHPLISLMPNKPAEYLITTYSP